MTEDEPTEYCGWAEAIHDYDQGSWGWCVQTFGAASLRDPPFPEDASVLDLSSRRTYEPEAIAIRVGSGSPGKGSFMTITEAEALKLARHLICAVRANRARGS